MHEVHASIGAGDSLLHGCDDRLYDKGRRRHLLPKRSEGLKSPWPDSRGAAPKALRWSRVSGSVFWEQVAEQPSCLEQGVPLRLELGMKDVEKRSAMVARRDTGAKEVIPFADVAARVSALLEQIQVRTCPQKDYALHRWR